MKNWTIIGYLKAGFIVAFMTFNFFTPQYVENYDSTMLITATIGALIGSALFGALITYIIIKLFNGTIANPNWNENPLNIKKPFIFFQFAGIGGILFGLSNCLGVLMEYSDLSIFGLQNLSSALGILASMKLSERLITGSNTP